MGQGLKWSMTTIVEIIKRSVRIKTWKMGSEEKDFIFLFLNVNRGFLRIKEMDLRLLLFLNKDMIEEKEKTKKKALWG